LDERFALKIHRSLPLVYALLSTGFLALFLRVRVDLMLFASLAFAVLASMWIVMLEELRLHRLVASLCRGRCVADARPTSLAPMYIVEGAAAASWIASAALYRCGAVATVFMYLAVALTALCAALHLDLILKTIYRELAEVSRSRGASEDANTVGSYVYPKLRSRTRKH